MLILVNIELEISTILEQHCTAIDSMLNWGNVCISPFFSSWSSCFWEAALWAPVQLTEPSRRPYATRLRVGSNPLWLSLLHRQHHSICHLKVTYTGRLRLSVCVRKLNYFRAVAPLSIAPYRLCSSPCSPEGTVRHSSMWPWSRRRTSPPIRKPKRKQRVRIVFLLNEWR